MTARVKLIGLDFGTTTSSAVAATAELTHNAVTGRSELSQVRECFRSDMVFTPMHGGGLDLQRLEQYLDEWLAASERESEKIFGGGALVTGLAAQAANAAELVHRIERRLGDALIVTAEDPCFESWLAFMGSCAVLSREHPETAIVNLDIGGGTTNIAIAKAGTVLSTGCLFVGARHVQVEPGTYRIVRLSPYAAQLFDQLAIARSVGGVLAASEVDRIMDFYVGLLEAAVSGNPQPFQSPAARLHQAIAFQLPNVAAPIVTLSGGVGELVYSHLRGLPWPASTSFGDLGIDLARRLLSVPAWAEHFRTRVPASGGRATVYGLLRHSTQVSGNTIFLPDPYVLPLRNVPIFGSISVSSTDDEMRGLLDMIRRSAAGGSLCVRLAAGGESAVRELGKRLAGVLVATGFPVRLPLVLLVDQNLGKVLGHCVTDWGRISCNLVVIDEVTTRNAQFIQIGRPHNQVVPVSLRGMNETGGAR